MSDQGPPGGRNVAGEGRQDPAAWDEREARQEAAWRQVVGTAREMGGARWENWRYWHQDDFDGPDAYRVIDCRPLFSQREARPGVAVEIMHRATGSVHTVHTKRGGLETLPWHAQGAPRGAVIAARRAARHLGCPEW